MAPKTRVGKLPRLTRRAAPSAPRHPLPGLWAEGTAKPDKRWEMGRNVGRWVSWDLKGRHSPYTDRTGRCPCGERTADKELAPVITKCAKQCG